MANDTEFGLASYFYTRDIGRAWRVAERLEYGIVGLNSGLISTEVAPFGGVKESGICFLSDTSTTQISSFYYSLSLHYALPICFHCCQCVY